MTTQRRNWLAGLGVVVLLAGVGLTVAASVLAGRIEPYARQEAIQYLSQHFDSDVQLRALHIHVPKVSPLRLLLGRSGRGSARIEGNGLSLWKRGQPGAPLFSIRNFSADFDLDSLFQKPVVVSQVSVEGMEIAVPPRPARPPLAKGKAPSLPPAQTVSTPAVIIQHVNIQHAELVLLPKDPQKLPLRFDIQRLQLESAGAGVPMKYDALMTNAKPPGKIHSTGAFGPWQAGDPGETPITGDYLFENADLGVFNGIAGTLRSTGQFEGQLSALAVRGEASIPNFRLRSSGNPVPLSTRFQVLVDATNGNTTLQPVNATLGSTNFTTTGGIIKHEANQPRAISLNVDMPNGNLRDVLRLAMKEEPFMQGRLALRTKIDIPPLTGKVREKLILDGHFEISQGRFARPTIQNQLDNLSRRASGHPQERDVDPAVSRMAGGFHLENADIRFNPLSFGVPGADLDLTGDYNLDSDAVDFAGTVKLQATVSQMTTGWKKWVLRPADRLFERQGAGTFLRIQVNGTSKSPKFGVNLR
jgi:hypothetical protein